MDKRLVRRAGIFLLMLVCALLVAFVPVRAATAYDEADIRAIMNQAFANGDLEVSITVDRTFSVNEYQAKQEAESYARELAGILEETALKNGKLMNGTSYS